MGFRDSVLGVVSPEDTPAVLTSGEVQGCWSASPRTAPRPSASPYCTPSALRRRRCPAPWPEPPDPAAPAAWPSAGKSRVSLGGDTFGSPPPPEPPPPINSSARRAAMSTPPASARPGQVLRRNVVVVLGASVPPGV